MSSQAPFSQPGTDILENYGPTVGSGAIGDFVTTIPTNTARLKSAILGLHGRLCSTEAALGTAAGTFRAIGGINEHFQVRRSGPVAIGAALPAAGRFFVNQTAFATPYTGGVVPIVGAGAHTFVQSFASGWYMATEQFNDIGTEPGTDTRRGIRLDWDLTAFNSDLQPGAGAYVPPLGAPNSGNFPGFYQPLSRHMGIEQLQGQALTVRMSYDHSAAIPTNVTYNLLISYMDGGSRYDSISSDLTQGTGTLTHTTSSDTVTFPSGVIPATATSVEVGLIISANTALAGNDVWDIFSIETDIGGTRASPSAVLPYAFDWANASTFYAQQLGRDVTGTEKYSTGLAGNHPILERVLANGGSLPTAADVVNVNDRLPWTLGAPWRSTDPTLIPDTRVVEVLGAVAEAIGGVFTLDETGAIDAVAINLTNPGLPLNASLPFDARGLTMSIDRSVLAIPIAAGSSLLQSPELPPIQWDGEVSAAISPIGY